MKPEFLFNHKVAKRSELLRDLPHLQLHDAAVKSQRFLPLNYSVCRFLLHHNKLKTINLRIRMEIITQIWLQICQCHRSCCWFLMPKIHLILPNFSFCRATSLESLYEFSFQMDSFLSHYLIDHFHHPSSWLIQDHLTFHCLYRWITFKVSDRLYSIFHHYLVANGSFTWLDQPLKVRYFFQFAQISFYSKMEKTYAWTSDF